MRWACECCSSDGVEGWIGRCVGDEGEEKNGRDGEHDEAQHLVESRAARGTVDESLWLHVLLAVADALARECLRGRERSRNLQSFSIVSGKGVWCVRGNLSGEQAKVLGSGLPVLGD